MKRMLLLIGLLALSLLVVSCAEGTLAGEVTKITGTRAGELQRACPKGCGPIFFSYEDILAHYGNAEFTITKTGAQVCSDMGYSGCVMAESHNEIIYFSSNDISCTTMQFYSTSEKQESCTWRPPLPEGSCTTERPQIGTSSDNYADLIPGDEQRFNLLNSVVCTR